MEVRKKGAGRGGERYKRWLRGDVTTKVVSRSISGHTGI